MNHSIMMGAQPLDWKGHNRFELPLTLDRSGRPTIPVRVMGSDTVAMIDSGSEFPSVGGDLVADLGNARLGATVNGERRSTVKNVAVDLGPASVELVRATVGADHAPLVIGSVLFGQAVVDLDFQAGIVVMTRPEAFIPPTGSPIALRDSPGRATVEMQLRDKAQSICVVIDTGYNGQLAVTGDVVIALALPSHPDGGVWRAIGASGKRIERPALAPAKGLRVGDIEFGEVRLGHTPRSGECSNLVGMGVLHKHRLIIDLRNHRMWILPSQA